MVALPPVPRWAVAGALLAPLLAGCSLPEALAPVGELFAGKPRAAAFNLARGHIQGRVVGNGGDDQPIGFAFVTTGSISAFTADPRAQDVEAETPTNRAQPNLVVMHDFEGGKGPELAVRMIRKTPADVDVADRYVYLRKGEFFLENVPEGAAQLRASAGNATSGPATVNVYGNTILMEVRLPLHIPEPAPAGPDGKVPPMVEWAALSPVNGVTVAVNTRRTTDTNGLSFVDSTVTYKPDPPDIAVTLKAPPGSPGATIGAYVVTYEYTTPKALREKTGPTTLGPIEIPTPPMIVPPAQPDGYGSPVVLQIPVGSRTLNDIFAGEKDDQPGLVVASIRFKDLKSGDVNDRDLAPLKVAVPLRAL